VSRQASIVGIGETALGSFPERTAVELQGEAIVAALADAGLRRADVDGLFVLGPYSQPSIMFGLTVTEQLGIRPKVQATVDAGGTVSLITQMVLATRAIEAGECEVVVCAFGENAATGRPVGAHGWTSNDPIEFEEPYGIVGTVVPYAMLTSAYMARFGTEPEDLGAIAISARTHATRRANALRRKPMSLDDYMGSRMIAEPLRLLDCSSIVDGAGALVLARSDLAADLPHRQVSLLGAASRATHRNVGQFPGFEELGLAQLGRDALDQAGATLDNVDVALIHDAFTISTAIYLEGLGFCGPGEVGDYAREGNLDLGGRCPVNTHGGLLSQGHVGGVLHFVEAVRQLRGDAEDSQVEGARLALVAGGGGILGVNGVAVLGGSE
jgi:acetyl-CoA acetyltransferase